MQDPETTKDIDNTSMLGAIVHNVVDSAAEGEDHEADECGRDGLGTSCKC